ncbi:hypothetical protein NDU88_005460 [Pleurodeles waltl]|uniref:Uncharacterized protein n=1 Tax=Pleurodeles waltl TaxID=8319 RepID=A0AAV7RL47_PLEWA|nr:hypothetical protein NDU88_005460 [Pleurodeles waltl]
MPGCHGDESVLQRQLRGAGKREALILVVMLLYSARALEERELLTVPMPGCHGDESVLQRQLRGAGKREALILVTEINSTSINYGLACLYYHKYLVLS